MPASSPCVVKKVGDGYVAVEWGSISVVAVYAPPRWSLATYEQLLGEVEDFVRACSSGRVMVAGDFNARSLTWCPPPTNRRGGVTEDSAASLGLSLLNSGRESTCVRRQGMSVVDLTWATPPVAREINDWRVVAGQETLSDHLYLEMTVRATPPEVLARRRDANGRRRRWALRKMDKDRFGAAVLASNWIKEEERDTREGEIDDQVEELVRTMSQACDVAMPRLRPLPPRIHAYWWTEELAELRRSSVRAKQRWLRARAGRRGALDVEEAGEAWRSARDDLSRAIRAAKERSWKELLESVSEDPWGRPYKLVQDKLRPWAPPLTETLDPPFVEEVVNTLFPAADGGEVHFPATAKQEWREEWAGQPGESHQKGQEEQSSWPRWYSRRSVDPGRGGTVRQAAKDRDGVPRTRLVECGVPQGSVLGPLLWIIAYDLVFRTPLPMKCWLSGYADDVYLGVSGEGWQELYRLASVAAASVVRFIERLGLKVAPEKTQVTLFYNRREQEPPPTWLSLRIGGVKVPTTPHVKYLGLWLDGERSFGEHVARVVPRAQQVANNLSRLMPNLGGASGRVRRLYVATVHSVLMYGAPIWWKKVEKNPRLNRKMVGVQRTVATRAARAYRTVAQRSI
ncbi:uncharacterized protein [Temnothorax nylanderi]|uniref:uncharacterized protein n=1 Tax=Temnothorax nylanderi TaxID=102681 RepID=UPI003A8AF868